MKMSYNNDNNNNSIIIIIIIITTTHICKEFGIEVKK